jgi:L-alanine-DL-glutamate epimerase-like enolase superfamily enzyme
VDANGAFQPADVPEKLEKLAELDIHSIEQPIQAGRYDQMAKLCENPAIPIALDEELIGHPAEQKKIEILDHIKPQFIILKPGLIGGIEQSDTWIRLAKERDIGFWATSALESNIGLNAIAQWAAGFENTMPQGLGTGQLYKNNIPAPLELEPGYLRYNPDNSWDLNLLTQ